MCQVAHVTYGWVMSRVNESRHVITSSYYLDALHTPHCVCHICIGDVTGTSYVIESCHFWMSVMLCLIKPNVTRLPHYFLHKIILLIIQYKYWKIRSKHFKLQDLILRTRLCSTLLFLNIVGLLISTWPKWSGGNVIVPDLYQLQKGKSTGLAFKYFYMIHRGGRIWYLYLNLYIFSPLRHSHLFL